MVISVAGRGRAPKDPSEVRRRNVAEPLKVLTADGQLHGPELPPAPFNEDGDPQDWPDATLGWWDTWRKSAQAATFTDTDWSFLLDTAILHMAFWDGDRSVAAELRLRTAKFGATPEDRARLKIAVGEPGKPKAPRKASQAARSRRERVLKAVGDGDS